ncbi:MAG: substrate-binding domain-containing protein [bacterium]|nr:substrate-binding domain-containing protein [bacterium]
MNNLPKYERVKRQLIREIESGRHAPGEPFPSESQLLQQFGVSRPTLVRSLQEMVRDGYLHRQQGKGTFVAPRPGQGGQHAGGYVVFLSRQVAGMTGAGREVQLRILRGMQDTFGGDYDVPEVRQVSPGLVDADTRRFVESKRAGAALVIEPSFCPALLDFLVERGWAVWSVNEPFSSVNCVRIDQDYAGYLATKFLLDHGCKRITLLNGPEKAYWGFSARRQGYERALTDAGLAVDEELVCEASHPVDSEAGRAMMGALLDRGVAVDGVVGASDSKAIGAMACAAERGIRVPDQIVFVSIDNTLACDEEFPLPAVAMPFEEMGFQAASQARMLANRRRARYPQTRTEVILRPTLVERQEG